MAQPALGSFKFYLKNLISFRTALVFGAPSLKTVFLTRRFIVPAIPEHIATIGGFTVSKGLLLMVLFAVLMVFGSMAMSRKKKFIELSEGQDGHTPIVPALLAQGVSVGLISGMVGASGGFLIIPALVLFSKLDMRRAVGTSLLIIAANSLFGFVGDIWTYDID